ncbi:hypothetical protein CI109_105136 [Kwoniella shandongensis]|uniref:Uncharacterized protein n=1 Tax=Kwoniella shandongensis TaxID=1734106 RepID=A0A5M6C484_9TREE|nr:uncharacterized protein CI109_001975 [Kwoniella shandongensis]KAA5529550.1 hypothetical protein CI109_001975 [Kwoniella shandongensis]
MSSNPPVAASAGDKDGHDEAIKTESNNAPGSSSSASAAAEQQQQQQPKTRKRRLGVDPSLIISEERSKRRRTPSLDPEHGDEEVKGAVEIRDPAKVKEFGLSIYNRILQSKDSDGEDMSQPFIKLPNKRSFPDYYETIKHPMSLEIVHQKLLAGEYQTLKEVCADLGQIFNNAKRYNVKESLIFQYAKKLHKMTRTFYSQTTHPEKHKEESDSEAEPDLPTKRSISQSLPSAPIETVTAKAEALAAEAYDDVDAEGEIDVEVDADGDVDMARPSTASVDGDEPPTTGGGHEKRARKRGSYMRDGPTVYKLIKPVLKAVREAKARDGSGRDVSAMFMQLPDRKDLPDYYKTIRNPISLEEIEIKHGGRRYETWQEFFDDMELMCNNAMEYNEDFSEVYRDAQQIKELLAISRREVLIRIAQPQGPTPVRQRLPKHAMVTPSGTPMYHHRPMGHVPPSPASYATAPGPGPSAYPTGPSIPPTGPTPYLPALPPGVVTEEVVASLDRYPLYEQQAWAQSLPPLAMQVYRQMLVANEARKQSMMAPRLPPPQQPQRQPQPQAQQPQVTRPQAPTTPLPDPRPSSAPPLPERPKPPSPTIKFLDFQFSSLGDSVPLDHRRAIRLHNLRGVVTHCVILDSTTSEVELTAYIADLPAPTSTPAIAASLNGTSNGVQQNGDGETPTSPPSVTTPEVSLRINGNQGSLPRFVFSEYDKQRPKGMRWTLQVPTSRMETKIEVVATKPGALAETSTIFVSRQY